MKNKNLVTLFVGIIVILLIALVYTFANKNAVVQNTSNNNGSINNPLNKNTFPSALSENKVKIIEANDRNDTVEDLPDIFDSFNGEYYFRSFDDTISFSRGDFITFNNSQSKISGQLFCTQFSGVYNRTSYSNQQRIFFSSPISSKYNSNCSFSSSEQEAAQKTKNFLLFLNRANDIRNPLDISLNNNLFILNDSEYRAEFSK